MPGLGVYVGVDFGGEDGLVAQHFLDYAKVGPVFYKVGGKGVAEGVGRDFFPDAGHHGLVFYQVEDGDAAEGLAEAVEEEIVLEFALGRFRPFGKVRADGIGRHLSQRHQALLVSLADDIDESLFQIHVRDAKAGGFAYPESAAVEDLQDGAVAFAEGGLQIYGFQDGRHFFQGQDGGEVFAQFGRVHPVAGVFLYLAFLDAPVKIVPECTQKPGRAPFGKAFGGDVPQVFRYYFAGDFPGLAAGVFQELLHVVAVGCDRVGRHPALYSKVVPVVFCHIRLCVEGCHLDKYKINLFFIYLYL